MLEFLSENININIIGLGLSVLSIIVGLLLATISIRVSISVKDLKNLLLIQNYTKTGQTTTKGETFLLNQVMLKNDRKHGMSNFYIDGEMFIQSLILSKKIKNKMIEDMKKNKLENEFGANVYNMKNSH